MCSIFQSETGTIQRGYSDLPSLIAEYIRKGEHNGLAAALVHPIPPEGSMEDQDVSGNCVEQSFKIADNKCWDT